MLSGEGDQLGNNLGNPGEKSSLTRLLSQEAWGQPSRLPIRLNVGITLQVLARVTERWSCHQLRWGKERGRRAEIQFYTSCVRIIRHPSLGSRIRIWILGTTSGLRYKLGIFVHRMVFESTGSPKTNIWTTDPPTSRGHREEEESAEEKVGKPSVVSWKSNELNVKEE